MHLLWNTRRVASIRPAHHHQRVEMDPRARASPTWRQNSRHRGHRYRVASIHKATITLMQLWEHRLVDIDVRTCGCHKGGVRVDG
jgi:hypothetical protein